MHFSLYACFHAQIAAIFRAVIDATHLFHFTVATWYLYVISNIPLVSFCIPREDSHPCQENLSKEPNLGNNTNKVILEVKILKDIDLYLFVIATFSKDKTNAFKVSNDLLEFDICTDSRWETQGKK
jgi:hypothetical protein